jgi:hypothetical protein
VPVAFLSAEQCRRYGRFGGEPTSAQLGRYFHLDQNDLEFVGTRRRDHNRLGVGIQLVTMRFLATFLADPASVPPGAVRHVAEQLVAAGLVADVGEAVRGLKLYRDAEVRWDHQAEIRARYGYRYFGQAGVVLCEQRKQLVQQSVLVVGPTRRFIDYISSVLRPSRGDRRPPGHHRRARARQPVGHGTGAGQDGHCRSTRSRETQR